MDIQLTLSIAQLLFTLLGGLWAIYLLRQSNTEKKNQFVIQIYDRLYNDKDICAILYAIDKDQNTGEIKYGGQLEKEADKTLRFLDLIGLLTKDKQLRPKDLHAFRYEFKIILEDENINRYLESMKKEGVILEYLHYLRRP